MHCYRHALNLAIGDQIKCGETFKVNKLVKKSPQRETYCKIRCKLNENEKRGIHTHLMGWAVRREVCTSMIDFMDLWDWSLDIIKDTEMKAQIGGVRMYMQTFNFYFGRVLGKLLLIQTGN